MNKPKKSLGQHWLTDRQALEAIVEAAEIKHSDTVLEIGPGLGHLTEQLLRQVGHVIAVELDEALTSALTARFSDHNLTLHQADILNFDLNSLPAAYKVVANIPYYLTNNLLRLLSSSSNPPQTMVLLVQKEVAERLTAGAGQMSLLAVSVQLYYQTAAGPVVPSQLFTPPPKVDSQVVILRRHPKPLFHDLDTARFFRLVKAGFGERRKKLRSSLSGGLHLPKSDVDRWLSTAKINSDARAQELSLEQWHQLYLKWSK